MSEKWETIIVGGGQAGLATSYHLKQRGREHLVLEQAAAAGNTWRNQRWDSFTLVTPNWTFRLPGAEYEDDDPDGYMPRRAIVAAFERYAERFDLPVRYRARVTSVERAADQKGYLVRTDGAEMQARNVVIATGLFQHPRLPAPSRDLSPQITQLHSSQYRNPEALPPGVILVVGSGQSGCQIAEELYQSGRRVYLCASSTGRVPRRYRGKDIVYWLERTGFFDQTVDTLTSPKLKFAPYPQATGRDGGHTINLHRFARDGVVLLGHLRGARDGQVFLAPDLKDSLSKGDHFEAEMVKGIDGFISKAGIDAPAETLPDLRDGYDAPDITELDLRSAGIKTVVWGTGYRFDYGLVKMPVLDGDGFPIQQRGVTEFPGLFFVGLPWLYKRKSGLLWGVGEDAEYIATAIDDRKESRGASR